MTKVENAEKVIEFLKKHEQRLVGDGWNPSVIVGYTQGYSLYVHENLEAQHPVGKAKFLEDPFRALTPLLPGILKEAMRKGATLAKALLIAGLRLQRESQQQVPVDTGSLKGSAFTREEK